MIGSPFSVVKQIVESFFARFLVGHFIQSFGADYSRLKIIAEIGLVFILNRILNTFPTLVGGIRIIKAATPASFEIGQTGGAMVHPGRLAVDAGIFAAVPAA